MPTHKTTRVVKDINSGNSSNMSSGMSSGVAKGSSPVATLSAQVTVNKNPRPFTAGTSKSQAHKSK